MAAAPTPPHLFAPHVLERTCACTATHALTHDPTPTCDVCRELPSPSDMTTKTIIKRIIMNSQAFEERQAKKVKGEKAYYESVKEFVAER